MKQYKPVTRIMRAELNAVGTPRDTDEIRTTWDMIGLGLRINKTYHDIGDTQNRHFHLLSYGGYQVLDGVLEVQDGNDVWSRLNKGEVAWMGRGEMYNARVPADLLQVSYPGAGDKTGAVSDFYKLVCNLQLNAGEDEVLLKHDWFGEKALEDYKDPKVSPVNRLDEKEQRKFWEIVARNREAFDAECIFSYKSKLDEMIDFNIERHNI